MLPTFKCFLFTLLLRSFVIYSQDQSGFISIDCGRLDRASYTTRTSITYVSDITFIDSGESKSISPEYRNTYEEQHQYLRSFPQGRRNCYKINNITKSKKYLIRATFVYGNYDGLNMKPEFDLYLGANLWDSIKMADVIANFTMVKEIVHVPLRNYLHVCVVNTSRGTPFISTIELRPLNLSCYETQKGWSLALLYRLDNGPKFLITYRYPDDVHDRIWSVDPNTDRANITNSSLFVASDEDIFRLPSLIMNTAATPNSANGSLGYPLFDGTKEYYAYLHFAELESLLPNQSRQFTVSYRGVVLDTISPAYLQATTMRTYNPLRGGENLKISRTTNSTHPPIINAIEIYELKQFLQSDTLQSDADAMMTLKSAYGIKRNWQGDPCVPEFYSWEGLNCSKYGSDPPRIISLDLSSSGLAGEIPLAISNLTMLEVLDLSDNNFTGLVPAFLSRIPNLKVLNLEKNNLYGSVPVKLIENNNSGSLELSVGQNPNLCVSDSCKKKKNIVVLVVASVAGTIILLLIVAAVSWGIKRKLKHVDVTDERSTTPYMKLGSKERQFTWSDIVRITRNFERILGQGGFGSVFHGLIDGIEVAVKVLSHSSVQGYEQFHTEANLLMRIHHRNLTSLVGYCNDGTNAVLIYEYMANGDLKTHLSDNSSSILKWEDRIRIALEVAQGLEYLHAGCKPPIVHRDVKPSNILLNESFQAKLSDLGISKLFLTDGKTHESTLVAGTPGYLDPEYQMTNWLKDKSDVYSYGVVLLEIISGRPAVPKTEEQTHISTWVSSMLAKGDIKSIADRRLDGNFDINSVWKVVEIAMACVSSSSTNRPTMSQVVMELRECLAAEQIFVGMTHEAESDDFIQLASFNTTIVPQRPQSR